MKKIFKIVILFLIVIPGIIYADSIKPSESGLYDNYDYVIDSYNTDIVVNENNTFDIREDIEVYFNTDRHGIYRSIPLKNRVQRLDGTVSNNRVGISNLEVNNEYSTSRSNGNYVIKIGSESSMLTGTQSYLISYNYNMGEDPLEGIDEFYFNIIGNEWDTVIGNVTFTIIMPKEFDSSKLGFSSGEYGSVDNNVSYSVDGNVISGSYNGILGVGEGISVRLELEEGYFVGAGIPISSMYYLMFMVPTIGLIISFILWVIYGRDEKVIETVEFYPPEGFNSLEVGFLYKGYADNKDVTSLLIYLANKGYIKIAETEEKGMFSTKRGFKITKLKEYDGNNINEKVFLDGLFKAKVGKLGREMLNEEGDVFDTVTDDDLYDSFYVTMNRILSNINDIENKNVIYDRKSDMRSIFVVIAIIISLIVIFIIPTLDYSGSDELWVTLLLLVIYIPFLGVGFLGKMSITIRVVLLGFVFIHSFLFFSAMPIGYAIVDDYRYLIAFVCGIICILGMILLLKIIPKRSKYGNEILGKIKGFKTFLETVEKDKLESMVMNNPTYFYDILPYTYVLGVSDKWIEKFESISLKSPDWYDGPSTFNMVMFGSFVNSTMSSASNAMSSSPSSSSGGSSGGGSSGGGSGGGGGGSW